MTPKAKQTTLVSAGWSQWYHPDCWIHPKTVKDPATQDYTKYGMTLDEAYRYETEGGEPMGLPLIDQVNEIIWADRMARKEQP